MTTPRELTLRARGLRFRALAWPEPGGSQALPRVGDHAWTQLALVEPVLFEAPAQPGLDSFAAEFAGAAGCPASCEAP